MYIAVFTAAVVAAFALTGAVAAQDVDCGEVEFDGGDGDDTPYEISTVQQLQCVEEDHQADYVVVDDIDASETASWNDGRGFEPIGGNYEAGEPVLEGRFDGAGHTVSNLTINRSDTDYVALFSATAPGAEVVDVEVADAEVEGSTFVGAVVGFNEGTVNGSSSSGTVRGNDVVGGLVGTNDRDPLSKSHSSAQVSGVRDVGGLAGQNFQSTIERSYSTGEVEGEDIAGGLVGDNMGSVEDSYSTADIESGTRVGGLVGQNIYPFGDDFYRGEIRRSYSTGNVSGEEPSTTGGLVGENGFVVEAQDISEEATVENSYWDVEASGENSSDGGEGLTTEDMTGEEAAGNLEGFDFDEVWTTTESYPDIRQQPGDTEEDEGMPGFGLTAAVLALAGVLCARLRTAGSSPV